MRKLLAALALSLALTGCSTPEPSVAKGVKVSNKREVGQGRAGTFTYVTIEKVGDKMELRCANDGMCRALQVGSTVDAYYNEDGELLNVKYPNFGN